MFDFLSWMSDGGSKQMKKNWQTAYLKSGWVYSCVSGKAEVVSAIPVLLKDEKGNIINNEEEGLVNKKHEFYKLFHPPKKGLFNSIASLIEGIVICWDVFGEVFIELEMDEKKTKPVDINMLKPTLMREKIKNPRDPESELVGWDYVSGEDNRKIVKSFKANDPRLIHMKYYNPYYRHRGLSAMIPARHRRPGESFMAFPASGISFLLTVTYFTKRNMVPKKSL